MKLSNDIAKKIKALINSFGIDIVKYSDHFDGSSYPDIDETYFQTILSVKPFTMTSPERIFALCQAVEYVITNRIPGDIVECGVWKGGSMMAVAQTLLRLNDDSKHLFLFDTFEGMTDASENDVDFKGIPASKQLRESSRENSASIWCYSPIEEVKTAVYSVAYDKNKIHFIKGRVEDTIPEKAPSNISLLRLDTDWYESTRHELVHLFPRISAGGVIIIDDYGYWQGARKAVDEYISENKIPLLLNRIDVTGRIGVVVNPSFSEPIM